jgi:hypothetical protein
MIELAMRPGSARGTVTVQKHARGEVPMLQVASSNDGSTAAKAADAIHTAIT